MFLLDYIHDDELKKVFCRLICVEQFFYKGGGNERLEAWFYPPPPSKKIAQQIRAGKKLFLS